MYAIETDKLTKYYGKDRGILDLNLKINEGEIFGFIGPNGSGKTTTIRLFLSLLFPTSGSGMIFHYDIAKDGPRIKKIVGFMPTEVNYYENMTVKEIKSEIGTKSKISQVLNLMCDDGQLIRGKPKGGWKSNLHTYHRMDEYFPDMDLLDIKENEAKIHCQFSIASPLLPQSLHSIIYYLIVKTTPL